MLGPNNRRHLLETLRPPADYELECAIGTTFSLDLLTLLTVPLAFTLFEYENDEGRPNIEPLAILEALRQHAGHIHMFCQAGQIYIPKSSQLLYSHLEDSIIEVRAHNPNGVFHPKVWVLRFTAPKQPVLYRVLCLSRNLTFDRSWDTALVLEGRLTDRDNAYSANNPLGDFVAALPELAKWPVSQRVKENIDSIQYELRRVKFDLPNGFQEMYFHPLGIKGTNAWPFSGRIDRMLVVSPFLTPGCLARLTDRAPGSILISCLESLETIEPDPLKNIKRMYFMSPAADVENDGEDESGTETDTMLKGLHAKMFIADAGWNARLWTGSANATDAAFNSNVEFMVELRGKKSKCGIDTLVGQDKNKTTFLDLLHEFTPTDKATPDDSLQKQVDEIVKSVWRNLSSARLRAKVFTSNDKGYIIQLLMKGDDIFTITSDITVRCWPITLHEPVAVKIMGESELVAEFTNLSFEALTSFFAFEITAIKEDRKSSRRFVLNLPLQDAPEDRRERILRSLLQNKDQFVRLLLYILAEGGAGEYELIPEGPKFTSGNANAKSSVLGIPLFETLVKALSSNPEKLDRIARLVDDLKKTPEGQQILPEGFDDIWNPILATRRRMVA